MIRGFPNQATGCSDKLHHRSSLLFIGYEIRKTYEYTKLLSEGFCIFVLKFVIRRSDEQKRGAKRTWGSETSQYPEEKKKSLRNFQLPTSSCQQFLLVVGCWWLGVALAIPPVAASEKGRAQIPPFLSFPNFKFWNSMEEIILSRDLLLEGLERAGS